MKLLALASALVLALPLAGCALLQQLEGGGSGGSSAASSTGASTTPQGTNCGVDPDTSVTLCLGNSVCPGVMIDTEVFPGCGFRVNGSLVDVECSCGGSLCPLGGASCDQVKQLLASENEGIVCAQIATGTCAQGTPLTATTGTSSSGTCDAACRSECTGDPTCIQLCGC